MKTDYDIVIIGSRIAGSVVASKLGDADFSVLIIDKATFPSNTLSSHFFRGRSALKVFDEIGVLDDIMQLDVSPLTHQVDFIPGSESYVLSEGRGIGEIGFNLNVRRSVLDKILVDRVYKTPNVDMMEGTRLVDIAFSSDHATLTIDQGSTSHLVTAKLVIGADGRYSKVAELVKPEVEHAERSHRVMVYRYYSDLATFDGSEPFAAEYSINGDEVAYIFLIDHQASLVAISLNASYLSDVKHLMRHNFNLLFESHPYMMKRIARARPESKAYRSDLRENYLRVPYGHRWVLIGDAGLHMDPWSGLGIDLASIQASLLADKIIASGLELDALHEGLSQFHSLRNDIVEKLYFNTVKNSRDMTMYGEKLKSELVETLAQ